MLCRSPRRSAADSTEPGTVLGTARYLSPEQTRGLAVDARSDIFSLGIVLYEMIAGQTPFQDVTNTDVIIAIVEREPPPLTKYLAVVPIELQRILSKMLGKNCEQRYQTSAELLTELKNLRRQIELDPQLVSNESLPLQTNPQPAKVTSSHTLSSAEYIVTNIRQHKRTFSLAFVALLILASLASWFLFFNRTYALGEKDSVLLADFVNNTNEAVFDGALKQALAVQLEQTPFLNIFPEERTRETLRFMNRSPEEKLTREVSREIGQRQGIKATLIGTVAKFDRHYAITLEAINSQTGNVFSRTLVEAENKHDVLSALNKAAKELRARLGESLGSIQRFAAPLEEGTTSSLEALKAVSLAREQFLKGNRLEAITLYKHAIELDPKFALPVARLANVYDGLGQSELATKFAEQAYQLCERTSEREKFLITSLYYDYVMGEIDKEVELLKLWTQTYPRDAFAHNALVTRILMLGLFDQGVIEAKISIQLDPNYVFPLGNLAAGLVRLGRYDEANAAIATARERKLDSTFYHFILYRTAFIQGNENLMQQQLDAAKGRPDEFGALNWHSQALAFNGHLKESEAMVQRSITMAEQRHLDEVAAALTIEAALRQALVEQKKATLNSLTKLPLSFRKLLTIAAGNRFRCFIHWRI